METYNPGFGYQAGGPSESMEIFISCRQLKDLDVVGKSDPMCIVYLKNDSRSEWKYLGKTEVVNESLEPDFAQSFIFDYYFEKNQEIRFEVYDDDGSRKEEQGMHTTTVADLLGAKKQTYVGDLVNSKNKGGRGKIIVKSDSVKNSNKVANMTVKVRNLKSKKFFFC